MVWSPTNFTVADGDWSNAATWNSGVPDIDDYCGITHNIAVDAITTYQFAGLYLNAGKLRFDPGARMEYKDAAGTHTNNAHILITTATGSGWYSYGTFLSTCYLKCQNASATYPLKMQINDLTPETRSFNFSFFEFRNSAIFLGNDTYPLWFNTGNSSNGYVTKIPLPVNEPKIASHFIGGRDKSRIYKEGNEAASITIGGYLPSDGFLNDQITLMMKSSDSVAFQSPYVTMPHVRIEAFNPGDNTSAPFYPFSLTLIEDL